MPEKLLARRKFTSKILYKVKWSHKPKSESTWELESEIPTDLITKFNEELKKQTEKNSSLGKRPAQEDASAQVPVKTNKVSIEQKMLSSVQVNNLNDQDILPETTLSSTKLSFQTDQRIPKVVDADKNVSPCDTIDLTLDDLAVDAVELSNAETAKNIKQKETIKTADQDMVVEYKTMKKPVTHEVEKVDFDTFILEQNKITESEQGKFFFCFKSFC